MQSQRDNGRNKVLPKLITIKKQPTNINGDENFKMKQDIDKQPNQRNLKYFRNYKIQQSTTDIGLQNSSLIQSDYNLLKQSVDSQEHLDIIQDEIQRFKQRSSRNNSLTTLKNPLNDLKMNLRLPSLKQLPQLNLSNEYQKKFTNQNLQMLSRDPSNSSTLFGSIDEKDFDKLKLFNYLSRKKQQRNLDLNQHHNNPLYNVQRLNQSPNNNQFNSINGVEGQQSPFKLSTSRNYKMYLRSFNLQQSVNRLKICQSNHKYYKQKQSPLQQNSALTLNQNNSLNSSFKSRTVKPRMEHISLENSISRNDIKEQSQNQVFNTLGTSNSIQKLDEIGKIQINRLKGIKVDRDQFSVRIKERIREQQEESSRSKEESYNIEITSKIEIDQN
eukprot:403351809